MYATNSCIVSIPSDKSLGKAWRLQRRRESTTGGDKQAVPPLAEIAIIRQANTPYINDDTPERLQVSLENILESFAYPECPTEVGSNRR
jgi:hypothetical protein